jgi:hypothetical protein
MDATNNIATDLFYKIRSRFSGLKLGAETGQITIMPEEARFFDFDYMEGEKPIGHVSISLAEPNSMKVYFSSGITESMDDGQKDNWYGFLRELRNFAKRRLLAFDTRDISKDYLDKKDYAFLSQNSKPKSANPNTMDTPVGESIMSESQMYGTKTMSYQKLMDTRLIVKHSKAVMDDMQPGARTRNISALFVENQDGERFKYPFIHLAGARAMQRHVANGGLPYDDIGKSIINMSEEIAQLRSFSNYVVRNDLMNSDTNSIVERGQSRLEGLREQIARLSKQSHYEAYKENFQAPEQYDVPDEVVEDFVEKFTVKNFKEDIKSVFPVLYRLMQEESTVGYDDIVAMTQEEVTEDEEQEEAYDPFQKFEAWAMQLGEESPITSEDEETKAQAIKDLQELVSQAFPAGVDGTNAIESLKGIIEDPQLYKGIKDSAKEDPNVDLRGAIQQYLELYAPDVLEQLDFGDFDPNAQAGAEPEAGAEAPAEEPQMAGDDPDERNKKDDKDDLPFDADDDASDTDEFGNKIKHRARHLARKGMRQAMDVKEVAEFINSFYDRNTGTFPKGPEGVVVMVGKKFGEQAEQVARKFVERMAPHQEQGAEQMQELARIRELSGMPQQSVEEGPSWRSATDKLSDIAAEALVKYQIEPFDHSDFRSSDDKTITDAIEEMDDKVLSAKVLKAIDRLETGEYLEFIDDTFVKAHRLANARIYPEKKTELDKFQREGVAEESGGYYYERLARIRELAGMQPLAQEQISNEAKIDWRSDDVEEVEAMYQKFYVKDTPEGKLLLGDDVGGYFYTDHNGGEREGNITFVYNMDTGKFLEYPEDYSDSYGYLSDRDVKEFVKDVVREVESKMGEGVTQEADIDPNQHPQTKDYGSGPSPELEDEVAKLLKRFDDDAMEVGAYGNPNFKKVVAMIAKGDPGAALEEVSYSYSDQDGGEVYRLDPYLDDLDDEFRALADMFGESVSPELEDIRRLSGIAQGLGY